MNLGDIAARLAEDLTEPVAIDIETTGTRLYQGDILRGFSVAIGEDSWYVPVTHPGSDNALVSHARLVVENVAEHDTVVMWNSPFDRAGLARAFGVEFEDQQVWDGMTVHWLTGEDRDHRLKEVGAEVFGADAKAEKEALDELKRGRSVEDVYRELREVENAKVRADREPAAVTRERARVLAAGTKKSWDTFTADDIAEYARQDAELTLALYHHQQLWLDENPEYRAALPRERAIAGLAYRMTRTGVRVDRDRAVEALEEAEAKVAEVSAQWAHVNLKAPAQVAALIYDEWGLPCTRYTKTGGRSTDKAALKGLAYDPRVQQLLDFRSLAKMVDAFYLPLIDRVGEDGRIHPSWNCHRVVTGRWSCSAPNLQQLPREGGVKDIFVPADGMVFVHADLPNAELRIAAILADEPIWMDAFLQGADLHQTMADAAGVPRVVAKTINFSALYGVGPRKLAETLSLGTGARPDEAAARRMLRQYWRAIPRVKRLFDGVAEAWERRGRLPLRPWDGRFRHRAGRFGFPTPSYRALNSIIQGSVGAAVNDWLLALEPAVADLGGRIVAQVHDAVTLEVPADQYDSAAKLMQDAWDQVNPFTALPWDLDVEAVF